MVRLALVIMGAATLLAQPARVTPSHQTGTGTIRGRVIAASTGDPVRNARVGLTNDNAAAPVLSDANGRFELVAAAGSVSLTASKAGYATTTFGGSAPDDGGTPIRVVDGGVVDDVVLALRRGAAVAGVVVDDTGEPVPGASVMIERVRTEAARAALPIVGLTDEAGQYRIGGLAAGAVVVSVFAAARSIVMVPGGDLLSGGGDPGLRIYYPGAINAEQGEPVELQAGDERRSIDFVTPANVPTGPRVEKAPANTTVVSGRVVSSDGRPLSGAQVRLEAVGRTEAPPRHTVSDAAGAYQFVLPAVEGGTFLVAATRVGYLTARYGQRGDHDVPQKILVAAGDVMTALDVVLPRPAVITGRIFDEHGDPVEGAGIQVFISRFVDGQRRLVTVPAATRPSDDQGQFRVSTVPPGDYIVSAIVGQIVGTSVSADLPGYAATYFPGTRNPGEAQFISVRGSEEVSGIDFSLVHTMMARVSGRVFDAAGEPVGGGIMLVPSRRSGGIAPVALGARIDREGHFEFRNVAPGDYVLQLSRHRQGFWNEGETASQFVTVNGTDVTGLELRGSAGSSITGQIAVEGHGAAKASQLDFSALPLDPDRTVMNAGPPARALINDDLQFELAGLHGPRRLRVLRTPPGLALKAIRVNGFDVTDTVLEFGRPNQSLKGVEVVLTSEVTKIDGTVADAEGQPLNDATVVAFALDRWLRSAQSRFVAMTGVDTEGRFQLEGLPSGEYYVAAAERRRGRDIDDPAFLDFLSARAARVTLAEGQHVTLSVRAQ